jgi:hypothetical protein
MCNQIGDNMATTKFDRIEDKLEKIHEDLDLHLPFDLFEELYENATNKKYNFLYIDTRSEEFRRNFNARYNFIL